MKILALFKNKFVAFIVLPLTVGIIFFTVSRSCEESEEQQELQIKIQKQQIVNDLQHEWPEIEIEQEPKIGEAPELSGLPPYDIPVEAVDGKIPGNMQALMNRIIYLVDNYPNKKMGAEIRRLIENPVGNEAIIFAFRDDGPFARFSTMPLPEVRTTVKPKEWHLHPQYPTFTINTPQLIKLIDQHATWAILVFGREIELYFHWQKSSDEQKKLFVETAAPRQDTRQNCEYLWYLYHHAAFQQCQNALQWGMPDLLGDKFCRNIHTPRNFDRAIFQSLLESDRENQCLFAWSQITRHPHPEAFLPDFDPPESLLTPEHSSKAP